MLRTVAWMIALLWAAMATTAAAQESPAAAPGSGPAARAPGAAAIPADADTVRVVGRLVAEQQDAPRLVTWRGRAVNTQHEPIAGARAWLIPNGRSARALGLPVSGRFSDGGAMGASAPDWFADMPLESLPSAVTDADGRWQLAAPLLDEFGFDAISNGLHRCVLVLAAPGRATHADFLDFPVTDVVDRPDAILEPEAIVTGTVVDEAGRPLAGVRVRAHQERSEPKFNARRTWYFPAVAMGELCETRTDEHGRFELGRLWSGSVSIRLDAPGLQPLRTAHLQTLFEETTDAGQLVMLAGGTIAGLVQDREGRALGGAQVFAITRAATDFGVGCVRSEFRDGDDTLPAEMLLRFSDEAVHAISRADGAFELQGLAPQETWTLYASAAGHEAAAARGVSVGARDVRLELPAESHWLMRVTDGITGHPLEGVRLAAERIGTEKPPFFGTPLNAQAADTREAGEYVLPGAGTLATRLVAWAPGHAPERITLPGLAAGSQARRDIALMPSAAISGQVTDVEGRPLPGAEVHLVAADDTGEALVSITADARGAFAFPALSVGRWSVVAAAAGYAQKVIPVAIDGATDAPTLHVELEPGAVIEGHVFASNGTPTWFAEVHLQVRTGSGYEDIESTPCLSWYAGTDEQGHFIYRHVPAGVYRVAAPGSEPVPVVAVPGGHVLVSFQPAKERTLRGRVTCRGVAVHEARIDARFDGLSSFFHEIAPDFTDENGEFRFDFPEPGPVTLAVRAAAPGQRIPSFSSGSEFPEVATAEVDVSDGVSFDVSIELEAGSIEGTLLDPENGVPWPDSEVDLFRDEEHLGSTWTDADGRFTFAFLQPGNYQLGSSPSHGEHLPTWSGPLVLAESQLLTGVILRAGRGALLTGSVRTASGGEVVHAAHVRLRDSATDAVVDHVVLRDGRFLFSGLADGNYRVGVVLTLNGWDDGLPMLGTMQVELRAGTPASIELVLPDGS